jgi:hypothetical protein
MINVGKTMPFLPPMTGNGNHTTYKNGDLGDGLWYFFTHMIWLCLKIWYLEIHWLIIMSPIKWPESFRRHTPVSNKAMFSDLI